MKIQKKETQLIFSFQNRDSFFEMGYFMLAQAGLANQIPYKRSLIAGHERITFQCKDFVPIASVLPKLTHQELVDSIYISVYITKQIEQSGLMKKNCIWCEYSQVFYDTNAKRPVFIMLPIIDEVTVEDGLTWHERYLQMMQEQVSYLPKEQQQILPMIAQYLAGKQDFDALLVQIEQLGNGKSGLLVPHQEKVKEKELSLHYSGIEGTLEFAIQKEEFVLGKNQEVVDGWISLSEAVSRVHCKIVKQNQLFFVQDLDSTNHTFVNGELIPAFELMELADRDILSVANIDFRVHIK